jgi:Mg/Co/Ni transporter MgtE
VAGDLARRDVPTCSLGDRLADLRGRLPAGSDDCVVVNEARIVLGLLHMADLASDPDATVEQVMDPAPSTFRIDVPLEDLVEHLRHNRLKHTWITTSDGVLVGVLSRAEAERRLAECHQGTGGEREGDSG